MYLVKAEANQIEKIVAMSVRAFETDVNVGGIKGDCPPEYDSIKWHQQIAREGHLYQAMIGNDLVGAAIVFPDETENSVYIELSGSPDILHYNQYVFQFHCFPFFKKHRFDAWFTSNLSLHQKSYKLYAIFFFCTDNLKSAFLCIESDIFVFI